MVEDKLDSVPGVVHPYAPFFGEFGVESFERGHASECSGFEMYL